VRVEKRRIFSHQNNFMKNLKLVLAACILTMGLSANAFAGSPKNETKPDATVTLNGTAETTSVNKSKAATTTFTYYVTALSGGVYSIENAEDVIDPPACTGTVSPCEITATQDLGMSVSKSDVDHGNKGIIVVSQQPQL
jgi:hypothetical protein